MLDLRLCFTCRWGVATTSAAFFLPQIRKRFRICPTRFLRPPVPTSRARSRGTPDRITPTSRATIPPEHLPGRPHWPPAPAPGRRRYPLVPIPSCPCLLSACGPDIGHLVGQLGRFRLLCRGPKAAQEGGNVDVVYPAALDVGHRTRPASPAQVVHGQPCGLTRLLNGLEWRLLLC